MGKSPPSPPLHRKRDKTASAAGLPVGIRLIPLGLSSTGELDDSPALEIRQNHSGAGVMPMVPGLVILTNPGAPPR